MSEKTATLIVERIAIDLLKPHPKNPRRHPVEGSSEWNALRKSLENDYFDPVVWNMRNGMLVSGHFRVKIMRKDGYTHIDCVVVDYDEKTHLARMIAANTHSGKNDKDLLQEIVADLNVTPDMIDLTGFTTESVVDLMRPSTEELTPKDRDEKNETLAQKFGLTPLSVLDARQHYWKKRKEAWEGILDGESEFDPVLAESAMRWYLPEGGKVIDITGKEPLRGLVAGYIGVSYTGLADDGSSAANTAFATTKIDLMKEKPVWEKVNEQGGGFDLALYEMPQFSTIKDMRESISLAFSKAQGYLRDNRFFVIWAGRQMKNRKLSDPTAESVGFAISMCGSSDFTLHGESIILRQLGGTPMQCRAFPATRKLARCHSTMLILYKGQKEEIERQFPFPSMGELAE